MTFGSAPAGEHGIAVGLREHAAGHGATPRANAVGVEITAGGGHLAHAVGLAPKHQRRRLQRRRDLHGEAVLTRVAQRRQRLPPRRQRHPLALLLRRPALQRRRVGRAIALCRPVEAAAAVLACGALCGGEPLEPSIHEEDGHFGFVPRRHSPAGGSARVVGSRREPAIRGRCEHSAPTAPPGRLESRLPAPGPTRKASPSDSLPIRPGAQRRRELPGPLTCARTPEARYARRGEASRIARRRTASCWTTNRPTNGTP